MELIVKQHISGTKGTYEVGDKIVVDDATALRYIKKEIALPKKQKDLEEFLKKAQEIEKAQAEKEAQAKALLEQERLKAEVIVLYGKVVEKEAELKGEVLDNEEIVTRVEELLKRVEEV